MKITDRQIAAWQGKPPAKAQDHRVGDGFTVRVQPTGTVSFLFVYTRDGKRRALTLGKYGAMRLADARDRHQELLGVLRGGGDPWVEGRVRAENARQERERQLAEQEQAAAEKARLASLGTVEQLFDFYLRDLELDGKRSAADIRNLYERNIAPAIGAMRANEVSTDDVADIIATVVERNALVLANRVRGYLISAFNFGMRAAASPRWRKKVPDFALTANPASLTQKALTREPRGQRYLSKEEVRQVWSALGTPYAASCGRGITRPAGPSLATQIALKFLLASGQRVEEVLHSTWDEFGLDAEGGPVWIIPAERRKNGAKNASGEPHLVPLAPLHLRLLDELRPCSGSGLLFPASHGGKRAHQTLSKAIYRICARHEVARFSPRDLRRSWKTLAGSIGIDLEIRNRIQGHAFDGVGSAHYDRYSYLAEKRSGMERWALWLGQVISGQPAKVLPIGSRRAG